MAYTPPPRLFLPLPLDDSGLRSEMRLARAALAFVERRLEDVIGVIERREHTRALLGTVPSDSVLDAIDMEAFAAYDATILRLRQRIEDIYLTSEGRVS
jgi:hypothetical protein